MPSLFDPITLGAISAPNRILMAPTTRARATDAHVPTPLMAEHYRQRASAGLIIAEATGISPTGFGFPRAPGLWNKDQVEGWKLVTDAVHEAGGRIVAQLWHMGRLARSYMTGVEPISASATRAPATMGTGFRVVRAQIPGPKDGTPMPDDNPYTTARALDRAGIRRVQEEFATAARNAMAAGFDGVQLHGANGYLIDQFLRNSTNLRDDEYGGSPENRIRFMRETVEAVIAEVGANRTSIRLTPNGETQGCDDSDPESVFLPAAAALDALGIAFLELKEQTPEGTSGRTDVPKLSPAIRRVFHRPLVLNQEYGLRDGQAALDSGIADAISWGRLFISNPDLPARFRAGAELLKPNDRYYYTAGPEGYTDYPLMSQG